MQMQVCVKGFLQIPLNGWGETSCRVGGMCQAIDDGVSMTVWRPSFPKKGFAMAMWWHNPTNLSMDIFGPNTRRESGKETMLRIWCVCLTRRRKQANSLPRSPIVPRKSPRCRFRGGGIACCVLLWQVPSPCSRVQRTGIALVAMVLPRVAPTWLNPETEVYPAASMTT
jgi:hypothetical protein